MVDQMLQMGFEVDEALQAIEHCKELLTPERLQENYNKKTIFFFRDCCKLVLLSLFGSVYVPLQKPKSVVDRLGNDKVAETAEKRQDQLPFGYIPPQPGEEDYFVIFSERTLGFEITPCKDGNNCRVERRVSNYAMEKVSKDWIIAQVNDKWLYGQTFETVCNSIKAAAESPPLTIRFRRESKGKKYEKTILVPFYLFIIVCSFFAIVVVVVVVVVEKKKKVRTLNAETWTETEGESGKSEEHSSCLFHKHHTQSPYSSLTDGEKSVAYGYDDNTHSNGETSQHITVFTKKKKKK
ncbi:hypothetical protein RFI_38950 [Reticulomyxa filosa]|uniref:Uncharacterized protein n=1 Tax=Reticulomyxa filosa TaxID=46433 RepID=X6LCR4_RETFI|nr:hypothetical protein RFI_38950 [Reticulomyxa filosa]|eukprot:ETN98539.1 hypothetical protein RFI_38950 [Reticulomyxa filosa]